MNIENVQVLFEGFETHALVTVRLRSGATHDYLVDDHGNAASIFPYDPVRRVALLVRQYRAPLAYVGMDAVSLEMPSGIVERGETCEAAARREAFEEAGLRAKSLAFAGLFWTMPGISTERSALYFAEYSPADRATSGGGLAPEGEDIEVVEIPLSELARMADAGNLPELKLFSALQTLRIKHPHLFRSEHDLIEPG